MLTLWQKVLAAEAAITKAQDAYTRASGPTKEAARKRLVFAMDTHAVIARQLCAAVQP